MLSGELTFPIETAFIAIVLPVVCAYVVLICVAATRIMGTGRGEDMRIRSGFDGQSS